MTLAIQLSTFGHEFTGKHTMTALEIAQELVRLPSVNPLHDETSAGEGAVVDWLEQWGQSHDLQTLREPALPGRDNISFTIKNGDGPHLLLNGHTDTVSVTGMSIDPFSGEVRDGRLWGRGSTDMKGPLACMLAALLELRARNDWHGTVTVGCVVDEETEFQGIVKLIEGHDPWDFAVVGEPTELRVVRGCKGCLRTVVRVRGRAAHSSDPAQGRNAIVGMAPMLEAMQEFFDTEISQFTREGFSPCTGSVGLIEGGTAVNIVPDECAATFDIRTVPGQDTAATSTALEKFVREKVGERDGYELIFDPPYHDSPNFETAADHPLVQTACALRDQPAADTVAFGCDGSKLAAVGIPTIILGPGNIDQAHTKDEYIALTDLEAGTTVYVDLARALLPQ
ncbi:MAG: M20 family metallopeptidase [Verrucomicrobia subdivision 3 bacterium]|nr:M20 family metallopeptidase [Limisphaerales bacterium]